LNDDSIDSDGDDDHYINDNSNILTRSGRKRSKNLNNKNNNNNNNSRWRKEISLRVKSIMKRLKKLENGFKVAYLNGTTLSRIESAVCKKASTADVINGVYLNVNDSIFNYEPPNDS
uniref:Doublecortin domain-containing protein n=1 Tax=Anisakis simplex TaxID=6269 RepID=A0A0M3JRA9_ANISI